MPYLHAFTDQHCSTCGRTADFQLLYSHPLAIQEGHGERKHWVSHKTDYRGLFFCHNCKAPVTLDFRMRELTPIQRHELQIDRFPAGDVSRFLNRGETLSAIADWAHAIRTIGNDAVHDDAPAPSAAEAKEALEFTSLLVELLFSYPERVSSLRKAKQ